MKFINENQSAIKLKTKRKKLGMTQEKFAELLGISKGVYQKYESSYRNVPDEKFHEMECIIEKYEKAIFRKNPMDLREFLETSRNQCLSNVFCEKQHDIVNAVFDFLLKKLEQ